MSKGPSFGLLLLIAGAATACGESGNPGAAVELPPAEVFNWGGQPISFSPPPDGWRREKAQQGGLEGVRFIKSGSVGEEIKVAEHYALDRRDRCARLTALSRDLDDLDDYERRKALQDARLHAEPPINGQEAKLAGLANDSLDRAVAALRRNEVVVARTAIDTALGHARRIRYSLDEVVDRVMYTTEGKQILGRIQVGDPYPGELSGRRTVGVDYTLEYGGRVYAGRQFYLLYNNRLFVVAFQGLAENLPLFERVARTISFPAGQCEH